MATQSELREIVCAHDLSECARHLRSVREEWYGFNPAGGERMVNAVAAMMRKRLDAVDCDTWQESRWNSDVKRMLPDYVITRVGAPAGDVKITIYGHVTERHPDGVYPPREWTCGASQWSDPDNVWGPSEGSDAGYSWRDGNITAWEDCAMHALYPEAFGEDHHPESGEDSCGQCPQCCDEDGDPVPYGEGWGANDTGSAVKEGE